MPNKQKRIFGYDLIKTIAIFMIVFYHLDGIDFGTIQPNRYYIPNFNKFITSICAASVPLFLMVNGALILPKNLHWKQLLLKSLHLLFLFFFWKFVLQYLISYKLLSIQEQMVHFWFLVTLAMVYIISFFFNRYKLLKKLFLLFLLVYPFLSNLLLDFLICYSPELNLVSLNHTGFFTLYAILYYYLGYFCKEKRQNVFLSLVLTFLGILLVNFEVSVMTNYYHAIYDGVNSSFPTFGALSLSVGMFFLLKDISSINRVICIFFSFIGRNTLGIYLFHVLVIFILRWAYPFYVSNMSFFESIFLSFVIVGFTAALSEVIKRSRFSFLTSSSHLIF